jgi:hypothetical protein
MSAMPKRLSSRAYALSPGSAFPTVPAFSGAFRPLLAEIRDQHRLRPLATRDADGAGGRQTLLHPETCRQ